MGHRTNIDRGTAAPKAIGPHEQTSDAIDSLREDVRVLGEREECAKIADAYGLLWGSSLPSGTQMPGPTIAEAIRRRSSPKIDTIDSLLDTYAESVYDAAQGDSREAGIRRVKTMLLALCWQKSRLEAKGA